MHQQWNDEFAIDHINIISIYICLEHAFTWVKNSKVVFIKIMNACKKSCSLNTCFYYAILVHFIKEKANFKIFNVSWELFEFQKEKKNITTCSQIPILTF